MKKADIDSLISHWQETNIITEEQALRMKTDTGHVISEKSGDTFIAAITYMGAAALSLGAFSLIASNWSGFSKEIKLLLTILLPVVPLSFAYWQMMILNKKKVLGISANILGLTLIGGALTLIGQIYNLAPDMVSFLWTWSLLTVPFVFVFQRKENVSISTILIGSSILASLFDFFEKNNIDERAIALLMTLSTLLYAYSMYIAGDAMRRMQNWIESGRFLRIGSGIIASTVLFFTTFEGYARSLLQPSSYLYTDSYNTNWIPLSLALNAFFIGFLMFAITRAIKYEEYTFAFSFVRFFGLYLMVKYVTLFSDMLSTGLFFVIGGILFITGGYILEKNKKTLIAYMKPSTTSGTL